MKAPVEPVGRILYSQLYDGNWNKSPPKLASYDKVCECKGFSDDRPFSVHKSNIQGDTKPFKVVFHWRTDVFPQGDRREPTVYDGYYMMDVLEEHASKSAAQKSMRRFAEEAFARVTAELPNKFGGTCNCVYSRDDGEEGELHLGDLVEWDSCPGIVWRILAERRNTHSRWELEVEPVFSFLVNDNTDKAKAISQRDVYNYVRPLDLVKLGTSYVKLGLLMQDEARRRSE